VSTEPKTSVYTRLISPRCIHYIMPQKATPKKAGIAKLGSWKTYWPKCQGSRKSALGCPRGARYEVAGMPLCGAHALDVAEALEDG
jgi:hypothetical protein